MILMIRTLCHWCFYFLLIIKLIDNRKWNHWSTHKEADWSSLCFDGNLSFSFILIHLLFLFLLLLLFLLLILLFFVWIIIFYFINYYFWLFLLLNCQIELIPKVIEVLYLVGVQVKLFLIYLIVQLLWEVWVVNFVIPEPFPVLLPVVTELHACDCKLYFLAGAALDSISVHAYPLPLYLLTPPSSCYHFLQLYHDNEW